MDYTVICVPCMLEHVCYEPFSLKTWKISYVNWLNFVHCLKFKRLRPDSENICKSETKRLYRHVPRTCVQNVKASASKPAEKNQVF